MIDLELVRMFRLHSNPLNMSSCTPVAQQTKIMTVAHLSQGDAKNNYLPDPEHLRHKVPCIRDFQVVCTRIH